LSHTPAGEANLARMNLLVDELSASLPSSQETVRVLVRLLAALLAGGIIGFQREAAGKAAGLRTHMLVCAGTALFVVAVVNIGMEHDALSRVIQGLATGIGFLGAGAILKVEDSHQIKGLTTAAGIWMTAALGVTIGVGQLGTAAIGTVLAWCVLAILVKLERRVEGSSPDRA
jgi:putative Mg2+ transporter-C (MgtC) family protein